MNCPNCNGTVWCVEYRADVRQPAIVEWKPNGHIKVRYAGSTEIIEECGEATLRCRGCDFTYDSSRFMEV